MLKVEGVYGELDTHRAEVLAAISIALSTKTRLIDVGKAIRDKATAIVKKKVEVAVKPQNESAIFVFWSTSMMQVIAGYLIITLWIPQS